MIPLELKQNHISEIIKRINDPEINFIIKIKGVVDFFLFIHFKLNLSH